jgi:hypothetical protein
LHFKNISNGLNLKLVNKIIRYRFKDIPNLGYSFIVSIYLFNASTNVGFYCELRENDA